MHWISDYSLSRQRRMRVKRLYLYNRFPQYGLHTLTYMHYKSRLKMIQFKLNDDKKGIEREREKKKLIDLPGDN